jgi:hypothetical protein
VFPSFFRSGTHNSGAGQRPSFLPWHCGACPCSSHRGWVIAAHAPGSSLVTAKQPQKYATWRTRKYATWRMRIVPMVPRLRTRQESRRVEAWKQGICMAFTRKEFLKLGLVGGAGLALSSGTSASSPLGRANGTTGNLLRSKAQLPKPFMIPLFVPPVLKPKRSVFLGASPHRLL